MARRALVAAGRDGALPPLHPANRRRKEYEGWNGMCFADLDEFAKGKYLEAEIAMATIPADMDTEKVYDVYEDINSGAENLSPRQLRRAVHAGRYIDLVDELRDSTDFRDVYGPKDDKKEMDGELVLRAIAFSHLGANRPYKAPLKRFLSYELAGAGTDRASLTDKKLTAWLKSVRDRFERTMRVGVVAFGREAASKRFEPEKGNWTLSAPHFEIAFAVIDELLVSGALAELAATKSSAVLRAQLEDAFRERSRWNR
jgi:hypothetical protein